MSVRSVIYTTTLTCLTLAGGSLTAQEADRPTYVQSDTLVVAKVKDTNQFLAYSKTVGEWKAFTFPEGIRAVPVVEHGVCAFSLEGEAITGLVAIDLKGNWCGLRLPAPARKCMPVIATDVAVFVVDGRAYVFSGRLGMWDSVAASGTPQVSKDTAMMVAPDSIAVFRADTGRWAVAKTTK